MKLSIALPTHNRAAYLRRAVRSILIQLPDLPTGVQVALCIYDNHSSDETPAVCAELARLDPRIAVVRHARNIGGDANILRGLTEADGDFIWILGDDDYLRAGTLAKLCHLLTSGAFDVLKLGNLEERDLPGTHSVPAAAKPALSGPLQAAAAKASADILDRFGMGLGNFSSIIFSREFFQAFYRAATPELFRSGYSQLEWIYRGLHQRAQRFGHVAEPVLVLRIETSPRDVSSERVGLGLGILRKCLVEIGYPPATVETFHTRQRDAILLGQIKARKIVGAPVLGELAGTLSGLSNFRQRVKLLVIAALPAGIYRKLWVRL